MEREKHENENHIWPAIYTAWRLMAAASVMKTHCCGADSVDSLGAARACWSRRWMASRTASSSLFHYSCIVDVEIKDQRPSNIHCSKRSEKLYLHQSYNCTKQKKRCACLQCWKVSWLSASSSLTASWPPVQGTKPVTELVCHQNDIASAPFTRLKFLSIVIGAKSRTWRWKIRSRKSTYLFFSDIHQN